MQESGLTVEQSFAVRDLEIRVKGVSDEELRRMLVEIYKTMTINENRYKSMIGKSWGVLP